MNRIQTLEQDIRRHAFRLGRKAPAPAPPRRPPAAARPVPPTPLTPQTGGTTGPKAMAPAGRTTGAPSAPATATQASVAAAMLAWQGSRPAVTPRQMSASRWQRSRAMGLILDYRVPDLPMPLQQTTSNLCWATVATMMASWRDRQSWTVNGYVSSLGGPWAAKLPANEGLTPAEAPQFLATMGLQIESTQANFTAERWESMLRDWGPIWVTADYSSAPQVQGYHAHIVVGIHGPSDGDPTVDVIDPAIGREVQMPLSELVARYEQLARTAFAGMQIRHWPARAQQAAQQSLSWARQAIQRDRAFDGGLGAVIAATGLLYQVIKDTMTDGLTWRKSELRGKMIPGNSASKQALADGEYKPKKFTAHRTLKWDFPVIGTDYVGADFEVTYEYNGHCVANVRMTNTSYAPPGPLSGRKLTVDTNITQSFGQERDDVVAVEIEIVWQFTYDRGSAGTYTQRWVVFGDGRPELFTETRS
jgi:hypothetical protein